MESEDLILNTCESASETPENSQPTEGSQPEMEVSGCDLDACAARDEELWDDEHTSDEEEFDPEKPEDLITESAKQEAIENGDEEEDEDEDDSFVAGSDEEEEDCEEHVKCILLAQKVDDFLMGFCTSDSEAKERRVALVEVICDHYQYKSE